MQKWISIFKRPAPLVGAVSAIVAVFVIVFQNVTVGSAYVTLAGKTPQQIYLMYLDLVKQSKTGTIPGDTNFELVYSKFGPGATDPEAAKFSPTDAGKAQYIDATKTAKIYLNKELTGVFDYGKLGQLISHEMFHLMVESDGNHPYSGHSMMAPIEEGYLPYKGGFSVEEPMAWASELPLIIMRAEAAASVGDTNRLIDVAREFDITVEAARSMKSRLEDTFDVAQPILNFFANYKGNLPFEYPGQEVRAKAPIGPGGSLVDAFISYTPGAVMVGYYELNTKTNLVEPNYVFMRDTNKNPFENSDQGKAYFDRVVGLMQWTKGDLDIALSDAVVGQMRAKMEAIATPFQGAVSTAPSTILDTSGAGPQDNLSANNLTFFGRDDQGLFSAYTLSIGSRDTRILAEHRCEGLNCGITSAGTDYLRMFDENNQTQLFDMRGSQHYSVADDTYFSWGSCCYLTWRGLVYDGKGFAKDGGIYDFNGTKIGISKNPYGIAEAEIYTNGLGSHELFGANSLLTPQTDSVGSLAFYAPVTSALFLNSFTSLFPSVPTVLLNVQSAPPTYTIDPYIPSGGFWDPGIFGSGP